MAVARTLQWLIHVGSDMRRISKKCELGSCTVFQSYLNWKRHFSLSVEDDAHMKNVSE